MSESNTLLNTNQREDSAQRSTHPASLSELINAWEELDHRLISLHQHYASQTSSSLQVSSRRSRPQVIQATAQYSAILTPVGPLPSIKTSLESPNHPSLIDATERPTTIKTEDQALSSMGHHPKSTAHLAQPQEIWRQNEVTPKPQDTHVAQISRLNTGQSQSSVAIERVIEDVPRHSSTPQHQLSPITKRPLQTPPKLMADELVNATASDAELQEFTSVAERLMQVQGKSSEGTYNQVDSTQPAPLDELYESISPQFNSVVSKPMNFTEGPSDNYLSASQPHLTSLHVVTAPKPLRPYTKNSWIKMLLVSLISLMIGGIIAHFFLKDLIQLLGVK